MKNLSLFSFLIIVLYLSRPAFGSEREAIEEYSDFYFKINSGFSAFKDRDLGGPQLDFFRTPINKNMAPEFGLGIGYQIKHNLRADVELNHFPNIKMKLKNPDYTVKSCMNLIIANIYLDLYKFTSNRIFFGLGAGAVNINENISTIDKTYTSKEIKPTFKMELGFSQKMTDHIDFDAKYAWYEFGSTKIQKKMGDSIIGGIPYKAHNISFSLRFKI